MDTFDTSNNTPVFHTKDAQIERGSDFQYKICLITKRGGESIIVQL
jgi:hypothetical protein